MICLSSKFDTSITPNGVLKKVISFGLQSVPIIILRRSKWSKWQQYCLSPSTCSCILLAALWPQDWVILVKTLLMTTSFPPRVHNKICMYYSILTLSWKMERELLLPYSKCPLTSSINNIWKSVRDTYLSYSQHLLNQNMHFNKSSHWLNEYQSLCCIRYPTR